MGSEGVISPMSVREEVQKRQVLDGGRGAVCRERFASAQGDCGCHIFPWVGALQPLSAGGGWWWAMAVLLGRRRVVSLLRAFLFFKLPVTWVDLASATTHVKGGSKIKHC